MRTISYQEALVEGMREELHRDNRVFCLGQDIGIRGGPGGSTKGLFQQFGSDRIIDTPISEMAMTGAAVGAAMLGLRPVVEITVAEFLPCCMVQLVHDAANVWYHSMNEASAPVVFRIKYGIGYFGEHSHSFESWFMHVPGLKVVMPSTPYDAKGLLKSAVRDNNPVLFFEHFELYHNLKGDVPEEEYTIDLGTAEVKRKGSDVTVIATGLMVHRSMNAAETLSREGIQVEIVDPRTISPLDVETILQSVRKTGRLVVVHEARTIGGSGAEIVATLAEKAFRHLKAPPIRIGAPHVPNPYSEPLEKAFIPDEDRIVAAVRQTITG